MFLFCRARSKTNPYANNAAIRWIRNKRPSQKPSAAILAVMNGGTQTWAKVMRPVTWYAAVVVRFLSVMEAATVNIADTLVIFLIATREGLFVSKEQFDREKHYGAAMAVARAMFSKGIITEEEYNKIDTMFTEKYQPLIGCLNAKLA